MCGPGTRWRFGNAGGGSGTRCAVRVRGVRSGNAVSGSGARGAVRVRGGGSGAQWRSGNAVCGSGAAVFFGGELRCLVNAGAICEVRFVKNALAMCRARSGHRREEMKGGRKRPDRIDD